MNEALETDGTPSINTLQEQIYLTRGTLGLLNFQGSPPYSVCMRFPYKGYLISMAAYMKQSGPSIETENFDFRVYSVKGDGSIQSDITDELTNKQGSFLEGTVGNLLYLCRLIDEQEVKRKSPTWRKIIEQSLHS